MNNQSSVEVMKEVFGFNSLPKSARTIIKVLIIAIVIVVPITSVISRYEGKQLCSSIGGEFNKVSYRSLDARCYVTQEQYIYNKNIIDSYQNEFVSFIVED